MNLIQFFRLWHMCTYRFGYNFYSLFQISMPIWNPWPFPGGTRDSSESHGDDDVRLQANDEPSKSANKNLQANDEPSKSANKNLQANDEPSKSANKYLQANDEPSKSANKNLQANVFPSKSTKKNLQANDEPSKSVNKNLKAVVHPMKRNCENNESIYAIPSKRKSNILESSPKDEIFKMSDVVSSLKRKRHHRKVPPKAEKDGEYDPSQENITSDDEELGI